MPLAHCAAFTMKADVLREILEKRTRIILRQSSYGNSLVAEVLAHVETFESYEDFWANSDDAKVMVRAAGLLVEAAGLANARCYHVQLLAAGVEFAEMIAALLPGENLKAVRKKLQKELGEVRRWMAEDSYQLAPLMRLSASHLKVARLYGEHASVFAVANDLRVCVERPTYLGVMMVDLLETQIRQAYTHGQGNPLQHKQNADVVRKHMPAIQPLILAARIFS